MNVSLQSAAPPWLLLTFSLPKKGASLRVSVWRKLQRYGSLPLGNSGYLLPNDPANKEKFEWLATTIRGSNGDASVLEVQSIDNYSGPQFQKRFTNARTADYRQLLKDLRGTTRQGRGPDPTRLRRRFQEIASIDFFGSPLREQVEKSLAALEQPTRAFLSSEFHTVSRSSYRNRTWVTRPRPGIDRVMSAWLIRKFIDPKAKFAFATEKERPNGAVPYDMYEDGFGHRGDHCTFETLIKVFRIKDKSVAVMGEIVHDADIFDDKFGRREGFGIDEIMKGWAQTIANDAELLECGMQLAQGLYQSLRKNRK
ncbi:MAG: chromate resistance protein ChrB domain-containing protein [Candidatus Sulfotelmatobacter sp.]